MTDRTNEIRQLRREHKLSFHYNQRGGLLSRRDLGTCQISFSDNEEDYQKVLRWLKKEAV